MIKQRISIHLVQAHFTEFVNYKVFAAMNAIKLALMTVSAKVNPWIILEIKTQNSKNHRFSFIQQESQLGCEIVAVG